MSDFKVDYIGIGANKAGTSWVNKMLSAHPQICTSEPKEIHFFHDKEDFTRSTHMGNFKKGLEWYMRFFSHCPEGKIKGEITPKYMVDDQAPSRIRQYFPEAKIIMCLRSPIDRATSQYHFERHFTKHETRPMSKAIREESMYIENGLYFKALKRYMEAFPLSKIHLIWFEDIKRDPANVVRALYHFLGVDEEFVPTNLRHKQNASKQSKLKWIVDFLANGERFMTAMGFSRLVRGLKTIKVNKLIAWFNTQPITYDQPSLADRTWMLDQFQEDIINLEKLTGRDLSSWKA